MQLTPLTAISPIDGRYFGKTAELRPIFSEYGLFRFRVLVEIHWLKTLADEPQVKEIEPFSNKTRQELDALIKKFDYDDAQRIKDLEATTNHDIKAIEYFLKEKIKKNPELKKSSEFIHFACTSDDINNLAYALMLKEAREKCLLPSIQQLVEKLKNLAKQYGGTLFAVASVAGIIAGVREAAAYANSLGKISEKLNENIEDLDAWGGAVKKTGGSVEAFQGSLQSLNDNLDKFAATGKSDVLPFFEKLGIKVTDANGVIKSSIALLPEVAKRFEKLNWVRAQELGKGIGLDSGTIALLYKGGKAVDDLIKRQKELGVVTQHDADVAKKFNEQWDDTSHAFRGIFTIISTLVLPIFTSVSKVFENIARYFTRHATLIEGALIAIGTAVLIFVVPPLVTAAASAIALYWPFLLIVGIVTALGAAFALAYDDIMTFLSGGDSLVGELSKKWPIVGEIVHGLVDLIKEFISVVSNPGVLIDEIFKSIMDGVNAVTALIRGAIDSIVNAYNKVKSAIGFGGGDVSLVSRNINENQNTETKKNEIPSNAAVRQNVLNAQDTIRASAISPIASQTSTSLATTSNTKTLNKNTNVQTGPITIQTQATDADGIAGAVGTSMRDQIRQAVGNFDDGVAA